MRKAAGILFIAPDNTALFLKRGNGGDHPNEFCFPGGTQEDGEDALQCALRETVEELGFQPDGTAPVLWTRRIKADPCISVITPAQEVGAVPVPPPADLGAKLDEVDFTTFLVRVKEKFEPKTNGEHTGWGWFAVDAPPEPLHPGCRVALARLTMDEYGVAQAIANGELTSPQVYHNVTLFALRITGTGFAYRPRLNEFVYRRPENYLTPEFLARCNGLPVIMLHPGKAILDSKEFGERIVGTMLCPYIQADEVWGIGKIYDDKAIKFLNEDMVSTSPGVVLANGSKKMTLDDGATLLFEEKASLLDHLALCSRGVWDKGEEPNGVISTTAKDQAMTEEEKLAAEKARKDAEDKAKADAANSGVEPDKMLKCIDAMMTTMDSMGKRMDAMEEGRKADSVKMDALVGEMAARKDAADKGEEEKKKADAAAEEEKKKADAAAEEEKKKADSANGDTKVLSSRIEELAAIVAGRKPEEEAQFATVQARADDAYHALGSAAPRALSGENLIAYRRRLLTTLQPHSPTWKSVDMLKINDSVAFDVAEGQILADALTAATSASGVPEDTLRPVVRTDSTGRNITTFYGRPRAWMGSFMLPSQYLTGINKDPIH